VEVVPEIDSTNSELMRRARNGQQEPLLLVAERQSAGRGRMGRQWHTESPQQALTFSLGLMLSPLDWSGLSLAVGLSLARSLHPDIRLKWPNDLWWQGQKLAGILIETAGSGPVHAARYLVIGVGINLQTPAFTGLTMPAVGLAEIRPDLDKAQCLSLLLSPLIQTLNQFEQFGFAQFQADFNARDAISQTAVTLSDGRHGVAQGVNRQGALQVNTAAEVLSVSSAEISVRLQVKAPSALHGR
jgi:BirA family biotin operon repressor/biotin-[acetyl-CoA-carboxylase] ligase